MTDASEPSGTEEPKQGEAAAAAGPEKPALAGIEDVLKKLPRCACVSMRRSGCRAQIASPEARSTSCAS